MAGLGKTRLMTVDRMLSLLLILLIVAGIHEGLRLYQKRQYNRTLRHLDILQIKHDTDPRLIAGKANQLAAKGQWQQALQWYVKTLPSTQGEVRQKLTYNLGTLYLTEAARRWQQLGVWDYSRVVTLLGLARESLRESVRLDPRDLNARYNLEYALRLQPPPREHPPANWQGHKSSVFATLPGAPQGGP